MEYDKTQLNITNKSKEVSPFPTGDHEAAMNMTRKHEKHKTEITQMIYKRSTALKRPVKIYYCRAKTGFAACQPHS